MEIYEKGGRMRVCEQPLVLDHTIRNRAIMRSESLTRWRCIEG